MSELQQAAEQAYLEEERKRQEDMRNEVRLIEYREKVRNNDEAVRLAAAKLGDKYYD